MDTIAEFGDGDFFPLFFSDRDGNIFGDRQGLSEGEFPTVFSTTFGESDRIRLKMTLIERKVQHLFFTIQVITVQQSHLFTSLLLQNVVGLQFGLLSCKNCTRVWLIYNSMSCS